MTELLWISELKLFLKVKHNYEKNILSSNGYKISEFWKARLATTNNNNRSAQLSSNGSVTRNMSTRFFLNFGINWFSFIFSLMLKLNLPAKGTKSYYLLHDF
jgi:hypothetical protein